MYHWLEVAKYLLKVVAYPAAHVISERFFSAVGGNCMKRIRLLIKQIRPG